MATIRRAEVLHLGYSRLAYALFQRSLRDVHDSAMQCRGFSNHPRRLRAVLYFITLH